MASDKPHSPDVIIREMSIDDLAPVYHMGERLFTCDLYPFLYRTWDEWEVVGHYNTDPEFCMVAEVDGTLAGFIIGTLISKASWTYGYIIWIGVEPKFHSCGIGHKLFDKMVDRMVAEGARYLIADTDPSNGPALRFFNSKGFSSEQDHVIMTLNLHHCDMYQSVLKKHGSGAAKETHTTHSKKRRNRTPVEPKAGKTQGVNGNGRCKLEKDD
ncbi:GNAT family N-acetyltransferase [Oleidesulfovibrio sp.]|uniref:GNAT family N-acetyltransferase n=1 Tax=Oleidesulfovibrio sp. TaxID=2909707 RepID=UPI003A859D72